ncbi:hypothetical protein [Haliscomenobacter sp.]|uniref:hypothetical protein n=1 Tax=Haliscomenobacter sp. TaxID=2717303 RepID=UPI0035944126
MKKMLILCFVALGWSISAQAQSSAWQALNYQAVALDDNGQPMKNRSVRLRVSLSGNDHSALPFYVENHKVSTDEIGAFKIAIGRGNPLNGRWVEVPWSKESIWMRIEIASNEQQTYELVSDKQLLAVPFAFHAKTSRNLIPPTESSLEKASSIYWNTSGNAGTQPPTHFLGTADNQNVTFRTNNIAHMTLTTQGKLELRSKIAAGSQDKKASYPMVVEGTQNIQGMWIKINGSRSSANNFMTFVDDFGIQGRIEGQTRSELETSEIFVTQTVLYAINNVSLIGEIAALAIEAPAKVASGWSTLAGIAVIAKIANLTVKGISLATAYGAWADQILSKVGVAYKSGNGDYAEWLMRKPGVRDLTFGEVVGVKNGQVSLDTKNADHLMVVSKAPIVLGNSPQPDQQNLYEKIAFMGQVPVRVAGPVALNDYILSSGNNDGFAIAVHPVDMKTLDYGRILGVAWEAAEDRPMNIVTVAVGINNNDLAPRVEALAKKIAQVESYLMSKVNADYANSSHALDPNLLKSASTNYSKTLSDTEFDQYLDEHAWDIKLLYEQVKTHFETQNINYHANPLLVELFNNPIETTKKLRRDPAYTTQWGMIDQKIQMKK